MRRSAKIFRLSRAVLSPSQLVSTQHLRPGKLSMIACARLGPWRDGGRALEHQNRINAVVLEQNVESRGVTFAGSVADDIDGVPARPRRRKDSIEALDRLVR